MAVLASTTTAGFGVTASGAVTAGAGTSSPSIAAGSLFGAATVAAAAAIVPPTSVPLTGRTRLSAVAANKSTIMAADPNNGPRRKPVIADPPQAATTKFQT